MDNAPAVCGFQRIRDLPGNAQYIDQRQRPCKRSPLDVLQDQVIRPDVVNLANVRMIERGNRTRFLLEAPSVMALQSLDGDDTVEPCVACFPDLAHAPTADQGQDLVR